MKGLYFKRIILLKFYDFFRLAEISEGFPGESLERGDTGDSGRDLDIVYEQQQNQTQMALS